jgi:hypothetical protein
MKFRFLLITFLALIIIGKAAFAHTPADISIVPDFVNNTVQVKVLHPIVPHDERIHYLKSIEVTADDRQPIVYSFTFQKGDYQQVDAGVPDLKAVKKLKVKACHNTCLEKDFDIEAMVNKTAE